MAFQSAFLCSFLTWALALRRHQRGNRGEREWHAVRYEGEMKIDRPAFLHLHGKKVYISQFGVKAGLPLPAKSEISTISVRDVGNALSSGKMRNLQMESEISEGILWPNKLGHAPPSVSGQHGDMLVIPDGFLVPTKSDGNIFLNAGGKLHRITPKTKGAFYHEVEWHDIDGDGHLDIVVPRAITGGLIPSFRGELMWYRNPGPDKVMKQEWQENKIMDGPDVICHTKPYKGGLASFCSHFWDGAGKLMVHGLTNRGVHQWSRVIDDRCLKCFSVRPVDLDGDGVLDLLSTNHPDKVNESGVFGYEVPWDDLQFGDYTKHVLGINIFQTILGNAGVGAPGFAEAFYPQVGTTSGPKHIVVAGDGSLDVWHLAPKQGERFVYEPRQVVPPKGTTGELLVHDFNGDGIVDVLVPDNDKWDLTAFTFKAGPAPPTPAPPPVKCPWWCNGPGSCQNDACKFNCDRCKR